MLTWQAAGGFSLDASVHVAGSDRAGRERLLRYCARPPFALERLRCEPGPAPARDSRAMLVTGVRQVLYHLPRPTPDGRTVLALSPLDFLAALARLIPPPRVHRHRYHGVLAPNARLRARVVALGRTEAEGDEPPDRSPSRTPETPRNVVARSRWARLLARIYEVFPLQCPDCGADMRILAFLTEAEPVQAILRHLGLPATPPPLSGPRYNTTYIQCCGIGTITDSLSAVRTHVFENGTIALPDLLCAIERDFEGDEPLRQRLLNHTPKFGNDDDRADDLMRRVYRSLLDAIDGRPNTRGGQYHLNMLSTTCHVYFGTRVGATPDARRAGLPISDGTSPAHGADRCGPTAVCRSLGKMDQVQSGGTLLNQRFLPHVLEGSNGVDRLAALVRTYFRLGGHHIQFNVVDTETLRVAQANPEQYRDLLVRVAGYSDYFVDIGRDLQEEIIRRTAQEVC
jgi:hypothetical protein